MNKYIEIIMYVLFGGLTTLTNWAIYILCIEIAGFEMTVCNALAWMGAVIFAFVTNKLIVFQSKDVSLRIIVSEAIAFFLSRIVSGGLEIFLPTILFQIGLNQKLFGVEGFWAKAIVSVVVVLMNYIISKKIVFSKK